jgi:hypothetical protein
MTPAPIDLRAVAGKRYRVEYEASRIGRAEDPWLLIIPCRYGHVYPHSADLLGVAIDSRILGRKLAKLPGVEIWQEGADGMNLVFPPERFAAVAAIVRPKRRRQLSAIQAELVRERLAKYAFKPAAKRGFEGQNRPKTAGDVSLAA